MGTWCQKQVYRTLMIDNIPKQPTAGSVLILTYDTNLHINPDSKDHGAYMGPTWGRQDPGGRHVGPMILAIWDAEVSIVSIMDKIDRVILGCSPCRNKCKTCGRLRILLDFSHWHVWLQCRIRLCPRASSRHYHIVNGWLFQALQWQYIRVLWRCFKCVFKCALSWILHGEW